MENSQKRRRLMLSKNNNNSNYDLARKIFLSYLELCFYLFNEKKIKTIYVHQPSLLTTNKALSEYELEYFKNHKELGLYKNSNFFKDQEEFKKNYELSKKDAHQVCSKMGIDYIDFEDILLKDYAKKNIFYDNVHLTYEGSNILSRIISKNVLNSIEIEKKN